MFNAKKHRINVPMSSDVASKNFWFDNYNFSERCVEGSVSNLLCQLLSIKDGAKFQNIAIFHGEKLITAMNGQAIPFFLNLNQNKSMPWKSACG